VRRPEFSCAPGSRGIYPRPVAALDWNDASRFKGLAGGPKQMEKKAKGEKGHAPKAEEK